MEIQRVIALAVIAFSIYVAWEHLHGRTGRVRLYALATSTSGALLGAGIAQALGVHVLAETLNLIAIGFALAGLTSSPRVWEDELRRDLARGQLSRAFTPRDLLSWQAWLKLTDRAGLGIATLCSFASYLVGLCLQLATTSPSTNLDPALVLAALSIPLLFAAFSTIWLARSARKLGVSQ